VKTLETFDYVIAGGGTAGCLLANRLSKDPNISVLMLEAGGVDKGIWIHIPVGYLFCIGNPRTDWCYRIEPDPGLNGRTIGYARGRVLGGCSSINAMLYMRGQARDYDEWARLSGDPSWSWDRVLPIFKGTENYWGGESETHGDKGEWRVEKQRLSWEILDAWRDAAEEAGIAKIEDFNRGDNEGSSRFEVNQRRGVRWNATKAFLRPIKGRKNLTVLTGAQVHRLRLGQSAAGATEAKGVEFYRGKEIVFAEARCETLLAAGSIGTPHILQFSGIGPAAHLQEHGIPVVHDLPGVGENLRDHYAVRMVARTKGLTINNYARPPRLWGEIVKWAVGRPSILALSPSLVHVFWKSNEALDSPDLQFTFTPASYKAGGIAGMLDSFPGMTCGAWQQRPESLGYVRIRSADPFEHPEIQPNYLAHENDRRVLLAGIKLARRLMTTPELAPFYDHEQLPGADAQTDDEFMQWARQQGSTVFHLMGACRMGPKSDRSSVVDDQLRVRGVEGLRVADSSIMPSMPSANTNASTLMIAEKAADMILGRTPLPAAMPHPSQSYATA
jgi:choline dehydrogenase